MEAHATAPIDGDAGGGDGSDGDGSDGERSAESWDEEVANK
jgi:hypothetical protein